MKVAILLYEGFAPAEVAGTNEVLNRLGGTEVILVAMEPGAVRADRGPLTFQARSLTELPTRTSWSCRGRDGSTTPWPAMSA